MKLSTSVCQGCVMSRLRVDSCCVTAMYREACWESIICRDSWIELRSACIVVISLSSSRSRSVCVDSSDSNRRSMCSSCLEVSVRGPVVLEWVFLAYACRDSRRFGSL